MDDKQQEILDYWFSLDDDETDVQDTANHFGITVKEVEDIIILEGMIFGESL